MHIVITGGCGFLGIELTRALLAKGELSGQIVARITLVDRAALPEFLKADARVRCVTGDLVDLLEKDSALPPDADVVFHLAAAVSADCERDLDLGMRSNVEATQLLLQACRIFSLSGTAPLRLVFASSVAVFGGNLPAVVQDETLPQPQSSYGIQKFVCEQLVADYTRKGFVDGRSVRLMTVSVRPGLPNGAASGFLSGIVREPLAGKRAVCPVAPDTKVALSSPQNTVKGLIKAAEASREAWGSRLAMNLPALTVSVREMVAALERIAGADVAGLIDWKPDRQIATIVGSWPSRIASDRAHQLGLVQDSSFDEIIHAYVNKGAAPVGVEELGMHEQRVVGSD